MSKTFCPLPWMHLASHPMGHVTLCCESDMTMNESSSRDMAADDRVNMMERVKFLNSHSIDEIHNSDYFKLVRQQMLNDEQPKACSRCYKREAMGLDSKRLLEQREYPDYTFEKALSETNTDGTIDDIRYRFVELRLGNICNVKCRTCNPASSNKIKKDYDILQDGDWEGADKIPSYKGLEEYNFRWCEDDNFYNNLLEHSSELESLYINGGEPTLIKQHWRFLEKLVELDLAKNIKIWYSLNMTRMPDFAFDIWKHFKFVEIRASIDDIEDRNAYIRHATKWKDVLASYDKCRDADNIMLKILQTVSVYNLYYLDEFHDYWKEYDPGLYEISHNFVTYPDFMSPMALPQKVRQDIISRLEHNNNISPYQKTELKQMFYDVPTNLELYTTFKNYTIELDKMRGESFNSTFTELHQLISKHEIW